MKGKLNLSQFKPTKKGTQSFVRQNLLTIATFGGVIAGVVLGVILRASKEEEWSKKIVTASIKKELEEPKRNYAFNSFMIGSCHDLGFCLACGT